MQWLFSDANQVASDAGVNDPLFGDQCKLPVYFENSHSGSDDNALLTSAIKIPNIEKVEEFLKRFALEKCTSSVYRLR